jgi:hypothetical protein
MAGDFTPADGIATAVFLEHGVVSRPLDEALTRLSHSWDTRRIKATPEVCEVFKRVRVPELVLAMPMDSIKPMKILDLYVADDMSHNSTGIWMMGLLSVWVLRM